MSNQRSKYGVDISPRGRTERTYKGVTYDSKTEMLFYIEKIEPMLGRTIKSCERQVPFVLQDGFTNCDGKRVQAITYIADFVITMSDGRRIVYDVKGGVIDPVAMLKRKLFWKRYPEEHLVFICRNMKYGGWIPYEILQEKKRAERRA